MATKLCGCRAATMQALRRSLLLKSNCGKKRKKPDTISVEMLLSKQCGNGKKSMAVE